MMFSESPMSIAASAEGLGLTVTTAEKAGTFAAIGGAAGALSIAAGAVGALKALSDASLKASEFKMAATQATIQGQIAQNEGRAQALARRQEANALEGELIASLGASGVETTTGSAASAIRRAQEIGRFNVDTAYNSAMQSMAGAHSLAASLRFKAGSAQTTGYYGAVGAGISGAGGVLKAIERKKRLA
jgi:hypothetical protein